MLTISAHFATIFTDSIEAYQLVRVIIVQAALLFISFN